LSFNSPDQHLPIEGPCQTNTNEALHSESLVSSGTHDVLLLRTNHTQLTGNTPLCDRAQISGVAVPVVTLSHLFQLGPR